MEGKRRRVPRTRPYKDITITVYPDFVPRLVTTIGGSYARGITSGLSIRAYFAFIFEVNEYLPKEHKLTDFQIAKCVVNEYPDRPKMFDILETEAGRLSRKNKRGRHCRNTVSSYRQLYNKGKLVCANKGIRPGPISFKYNSDGERISFFSRKLLSEAEFNLIMGRYGPENRLTQDFDWVAVNRRRGKPEPKKTKYDSLDWCI